MISLFILNVNKPFVSLCFDYDFVEKKVEHFTKLDFGLVCLSKYWVKNKMDISELWIHPLVSK